MNVHEEYYSRGGHIRRMMTMERIRICTNCPGPSGKNKKGQLWAKLSQVGKREAGGLVRNTCARISFMDSN
jgi:hypothetical protein